MAKRNQIGCPFGSHDGGDSGDSQNIAFIRSMVFDDSQRFRFHPDGSAGDGDTVCFGFAADIDHVRFARCIEMGQLIFVVFNRFFLWHKERGR